MSDSPCVLMQAFLQDTTKTLPRMMIKLNPKRKPVQCFQAADVGIEEGGIRSLEKILPLKQKRAPGCLEYILPSYMGIKQPGLNGKSEVFFFRGSIEIGVKTRASCFSLIE